MDMWNLKLFFLSIDALYPKTNISVWKLLMQTEPVPAAGQVFVFLQEMPLTNSAIIKSETIVFGRRICMKYYDDKEFSEIYEELKEYADYVEY